LAAEYQLLGFDRTPPRKDAPSLVAASEPNPAGRYLLGDSPAEVRHLIEQAEVYAKEAGELLDAIGVQPGTEAIDVGCGVMGIVHLLSERIGGAGRVVGLDREPRMVEAARQLAAERRLAVDFVEADATASGLPAAAFDLVHARTLLLNVSNPEEILAEMVRIARPGGVVAVQEPDAAGWVCDPPQPAWDILRAGIVDAYRQTGKDFNIGRRTARLLREAGLDDVRARATARVTHAGEYYQTFLLTIAGLVRDVILDAGELTADEFDSHAEALRTHLDTPGTLTSQPLMWQAWGRVREVA
jgi:SAM-dependent methyltransferase